MSIEILLTTGLIVLATHFAGVMIGFGSTVLALSFVVLLVGLRTAVPALVIVAWLAAIFVVLVSRRHIDWRHYRRILLWAVPGMPFGFLFFRSLPEARLKLLLGIFVVGVAVIHFFRGNDASKTITPRKGLLLKAALIGAGAVHGAFGIGGPLLVIYASRAIPAKEVFRVTLCLVWVTLNTAIIAGYLAAGTLTTDVWRLVGAWIPFLLVGAVMGNRWHKRVGDKAFRRVVFGMLGLSGAALFWGGMR